MSLLSGETEVFSAAGDGRCCVAFLARRRESDDAAGRAVLDELDRLRRHGWSLSVDTILGDVTEDVPQVYAAGFSHDVDLIGMFEAPGLSAALEGTRALEAAGWGRLLRTEWLIGAREFSPVVGASSRGHADEWGFFALWKWNAAWQTATVEQRDAYDRECDTAFAADVRAGAAITGRHRLDATSAWDHIGVWRVPSMSMVDEAMHEHARVADFKFTTSRHYVGKRTRFEDAIRENA